MQRLRDFIAEVEDEREQKDMNLAMLLQQIDSQREQFQEKMK